MNGRKNVLKKPVCFFDGLAYCILFLQLILSCGFGVSAYLSGTAIMGLEIVLSVVLIMCRVWSGRTIKVNQKGLMYVALIPTLILLGEVLRGGSFKQVQIGVYCVMIAYLFSLCFSFPDFIEKLTNLVFFLCVCSLLLYVVYHVAPEIVEHLPQIENVNGIKAYHAGLSSIYEHNRGIRNQGIFWEPGAFQTFINLALLIELFYLKKERKARIIIFLLTIYTTFSTTGYIVAILLLILYIVQLLVKKDAGNAKNMEFMIFLLMIGALLFWLLQSNPARIADEVFGKLERYMEGGANTETVAIRLNSFWIPLMAWLQKPIWGIGYVGSINMANALNGGMFTCTFINWFAYYGAVVGGMLIALYYRLVKRMGESRLFSILLFLCIFLITFSEEYSRNVFFLAVGFISLSCNDEEGRSNEDCID